MMKELYENIRDRRIALKMTQQELASKLGYKSTSTIAKIESGENDIPHAKLAAFASALDTTPAELLGLKIISLGPDDPDDTETVVIAKGKPQLVELIKQLDGLTEKELNCVIAVINPLIRNFESGESFNWGNGKVRRESHPVV